MFMMFSLETYKSLKEQINRLLCEGEDLMDEDEFLLDLISNSKNSKGVLGFARELKEEGNLLFKQRKIDDAIEKYGYVWVVLARYEFVEEKETMDCFELAICILFNSAACFSRKNAFEHVGRICSIVLDFNPNSVKALFRRAMAAIELGHRDWAYWDLLIAANIEPGNREVLMKLEETKNFLFKGNSKMHHQNDVPAGLGIGLSSPNTKVKMCLKKNDSFEQDNVHANDPYLGFDDKGANDLAVLEDIGAQNCLSVQEEKISTEMREDGREERMKDVENILNFENSNQAEPKYRFASRRRPGSFIYVPRKVYQVLSKGKSTQYYNFRFGSMMTLRVVMSSDDGVKSKEERNNKNVDVSNVVDILNQDTEESEYRFNMELNSQSTEDSAIEVMDESMHGDENTGVGSSVLGSRCHSTKIKRNIGNVSWCARALREKHRSRLSILAMRMKTRPCPQMKKGS